MGSSNNSSCMSENLFNDGALNTGPFLDLAGYLKSRPPADDPRSAFEALRATAETLVTAQNVIHQMLRRQATP